MQIYEKSLVGTSQIKNIYYGGTLIDKMYNGETLCYLRPGKKIEDFALALEVAKSVYGGFSFWEAVSEMYHYFEIFAADSHGHTVYVYKISHQVTIDFPIDMPCTSWEMARDIIATEIGFTLVRPSSVYGSPDEDSTYYYLLLQEPQRDVMWGVRKDNSAIIENA